MKPCSHWKYCITSSASQMSFSNVNQAAGTGQLPTQAQTTVSAAANSIPVLCPSSHGRPEADIIVKIVREFRRRSVEEIEREVLFVQMGLSDSEARQYEVHCVPKRLSPTLVNFDLLNAPESRKFTDMIQACVTVPLTPQTLPCIGSQPGEESILDFPFLMVVPRRTLFAQNAARALHSAAKELNNADVVFALNQLLETRRTFFNPASRQKVCRPILYDGQVAEELIREGVLNFVLTSLADRRLDTETKMQQLLVQVLACMLRYALGDSASNDSVGNGVADDTGATESDDVSIVGGGSAAQQAVAAVGAKRGLFSWYLIREQCIRTVVAMLNTSQADGEVVRACLKILLRFAQNNPNRRNFVLDSVRLASLVSLIRLHGANVRVVIGAVGIIAHALACTQSAEVDNLLIELDTYQLRPMLAKACAELAQEQAFPRLESQLHRLLRLFLRPQQREAQVPVDHRHQREIDGVCSALAISAATAVNASASSSATSSVAEKRRSSSTVSSGSSSATDSGLTTTTDPASFLAEFSSETPPGLLALRQLDYLVRVRGQELREIFQKQHQQHQQLQSQQHHHSSIASGSNAELPMAPAAVALTKILLRVLCGVSAGLGDGDHSGQAGFSSLPLAEFPPLLLTLPNPFGDCFVACMRTFQRTWTESRANREDLGTVAAVVEEQFRMALKQRPDTTDKLRKELDKVSYEDVKSRWRSALSSGDDGALRYLTAQLQSHVTDLIARQRLAYMRQGTMFSRLVRSSGTRKQTNQRLHLSLSANGKQLLFKTPEPALEHHQAQQVQSSASVYKVPLQNVTRLEIGRESISVVDSRHLKQVSDYLIQLFYSGHANEFGELTEAAAQQQQQQLLLQQQQQQIGALQIGGLQSAASSESEVSCLLHTDDAEAFHYWSDGLNYLTGAQMKSPLHRKQLDGFVRLELEARLVVLAQAGVSAAALAASAQPTVCEPPDNYNFA